MKYCSVITFIFLLNLGWSQNDYIKENWIVFNDNTEHDTIRVRAVENVAWEYMYINLDSARKYALIEVEFAKKIPERKWLGYAYNTLGVIYGDQGDLQAAISTCLKALKIAEDRNSKTDIIACKNNLGYIYIQAQDYEHAEEHLLESIQLCKELGNRQRLGEAYINYAGLLRETKRRAESIEIYKEAHEISIEFDQPYMASVCETDIAATYDLMNEDSLAHIWYEKALKSATELEDIHGIGTITNNLGIYENKIGNHKKALDYCRQARLITEPLNIWATYYYTCYCLKDAFEGLGQYDSALYYYKISEDLEDSLLNEENLVEVTKMEMNFDFEKKELADSLANVQKDLEYEAQIQKEEKDKLLLFGGLGVALLIGGVIFFRLRESNRQKEIIKKQKQEVDEAYEQLEEKNTEILDSITYAKRIQAAILPPLRIVKEYLKSSFILYKPKDVVAGDFYWLEHKDDMVLFAAADCTGHGVPGSMISVICNNALNRSVREHSLTDPGEILDKTRELVIQEFEKSDEEVKDGMDIALCTLSGTTLQFAGAHNPLWIIRKGSNEVEEIKANKQPIGKYPDPTPYQSHSIQLQPGDSFYIFSDGFADQFGGEKGKKFKAANFKKLLLEIQSKSMDEQLKILDKTFEDWRGSLEQLDDVCIIGVRV